MILCAGNGRTATLLRSSDLRRAAIRFILSITACAGMTGCAAGITRGDLLKQLQTGQAPLIVDVRSQGEYDRDHLPGAVHIPFSTIGSGLRDRGFPKTDPLVLYCEHGPRSGIASFSLVLSGYEKVYSLDGHMKGWRADGYPVEIKQP